MAPVVDAYASLSHAHLIVDEIFILKGGFRAGVCPTGKISLKSFRTKKH